MVLRALQVTRRLLNISKTGTKERNTMNTDFEKAIAFNRATGEFFVMADQEVATYVQGLTNCAVVNVPKHYDDEAIQDYLDHYGYTQ